MPCIHAFAPYAPHAALLNPVTDTPCALCNESTAIPFRAAFPFPQHPLFCRTLCHRGIVPLVDVFTIEDRDQRRLVIIEEAAPEGTLWSMMEAQPACNSRMQLQRQSTWGLFPFVEVPPCFTDDIRRGASKPSG